MELLEEKILTKKLFKNKKGVQIQIELGGGIKDGDDISFWLKEGIDFLIIGSLAAKKKITFLTYQKNLKKKFMLL